MSAWAQLSESGRAIGGSASSMNSGGSFGGTVGGVMTGQRQITRRHCAGIIVGGHLTALNVTRWALSAACADVALVQTTIKRGPRFS
jgi:hypothetical protein